MAISVELPEASFQLLECDYGRVMARGMLSLFLDSFLQASGGKFSWFLLPTRAPQHPSPHIYERAHISRMKMGGQARQQQRGQQKQTHTVQLQTKESILYHIILQFYLYSAISQQTCLMATNPIQFYSLYSMMCSILGHRMHRERWQCSVKQYRQCQLCDVQSGMSIVPCRCTLIRFPMYNMYPINISHKL